MHSLLARDLASAVAVDRARLAFRRRVVPAAAATECGCDIVPARSVKAVVRPKSRSREAVCA
jgi:hypothetical protein